MGRVAVVILNWNGLHFLKQFLSNTITHTPSELGEVIVADNGSTDGSLEWMKGSFPELKIIPFDTNYGFTGGYNKAFSTIKRAPEIYGKYDYYLLLNSDVEVTQGWLEPLIQTFESSSEVAITSPKVLSFHSRGSFEYAGACGGMLDRYYYPYCRGRVLSKVEEDRGQYDAPTQVFWASGTSLMVRAELWHRLRGLDELFFAHMEEIDLCWRARLLGYQVWVTPSSVIYHVGGGTLPNDSPQKLYLNFRNNLLMMAKNLPQRGRGRIIFARMVIDGFAAVAYLLMGRVDYFKSVVKAHTDYRKMKRGITISEKRVTLPRPRKIIFFLRTGK